MEHLDSESGNGNFLYCYKSLLRVRGDNGINLQIGRLEQEWASLLEETTLFAEDLAQMRKDKKLLVRTRLNRNYRNGKLMAGYRKRKFSIPYFCFRSHTDGANLFKWEEVSQILTAKNATFDEVVLHMWVFRGMRDLYWRANNIADRIENLLNYRQECADALETEKIDRKMLPDEMFETDGESSLSGC